MFAVWDRIVQHVHVQSEGVRGRARTDEQPEGVQLVLVSADKG